jgi:rare lipoprotein A
MKKIILFFLLLLCVTNAEGKEKANATWYDCCKKTANGELFDPNGFTAAHRSLPFGTIIKLTNEKTGKTIYVRINDRGPFVAGKDIDVTKGGAIALGFFHSGTAKLLLEVISKKKIKKKNENKNKARLR